MNKLGNYFSTKTTTTTLFLKNTFSRGSEAAAKYLKFVYIGIGVVVVGLLGFVLYKNFIKK